MRRLFRVNALANYIMYMTESGDDADRQLIRHIYFRVEELIDILRESFDVIDVRGYTIAEFYTEIKQRKDSNAAAFLAEQINSQLD